MDETARRRSLICMASLFVFAVMAAIVVTGVADDIDAAIRTTVHGWSSPGLTRLLEALSAIGSVAANFSMSAILAIALFALGQRWTALHLLAVMTAAVVFNNVVKYLVARLRPEAFFGVSPETYSFPSGHALFSGCFYGFFGLLVASRLPKAWQRSAVLALTAALVGAIGFSRIYLGVHYATDVIAGFALAAMILCGASALFDDRPGEAD